MNTPLIIDTREPPTYRTAVKSKFLAAGVEVLETSLITGDYMWSLLTGEDVLVERKEVSDLLSSIGGGRWAQQVPRLVRYHLPLLLVEGTILRLANGDLKQTKYKLSGWTVDRLENTLLTAQMAGLTLTHCGQGASAVANRLWSLYQFSHKSEHESLVPRRPAIKVDTSRVGEIALLAALPGSGVVTARNLLREYGSVAAVLDCLRGGTRLSGVSARKQAAWEELIYRDHQALQATG